MHNCNVDSALAEQIRSVSLSDFEWQCIQHRLRQRRNQEPGPVLEYVGCPGVAFARTQAFNSVPNRKPFFKLADGRALASQSPFGKF